MSIFKCKMCGGSLEVDDDQKVCVCEYCGTRQTVPKYEDNYHKSADSENGDKPNTEVLLNRVTIFLADKNWKNADKYCEKALDINPECAEAYLGKLMAELKIDKFENLQNCNKVFIDNNNYKKVVQFADDKLQNEIYEILYKQAIRFMDSSSTKSCEKSIAVFDSIKNYKDSQKQIELCEKSKSNIISQIKKKALKNIRMSIDVGYDHIVGLKSDGTVVAVGDNECGQCNVSDWTDIVAISAGNAYTVGLKSDGTVVAVGSNYYGQCDVSDWTDIVSISAGERHTVGLKFDGTVVAVGNSYNYYGCSDWNDIVAISAGGCHTVGLKSDGTVVAAGDNKCGQCDVSDWTDIVAISAGGNFKPYTVGLKADGTVVAVGSNYYGQCDVSDWTDIIAISAGENIVGLKSDGNVYCNGEKYALFDCTDIVAISAGEFHIIGLKSDGTVVVCGDEYDVSDWSDIALMPNFNSLEEMLAYDKEQQTKREEKREEKRKKEIAMAKEKLNLEKTELNKKINELLNDIDNHPQKSIIEETKFQISKLKNEKESLNFFEIGKKKTLQKQIDDFTYHLNEYTEYMEKDIANFEEEINIAKARIEEIDLELSI